MASGMCQRLPSASAGSKRAAPVNAASKTGGEPACSAAWTQTEPRTGFQICMGGNDGDNLGDICIGVPVTREESPYDRAPRCAFCNEPLWW